MLLNFFSSLLIGHNHIQKTRLQNGFFLFPVQSPVNIHPEGYPTIFRKGIKRHFVSYCRSFISGGYGLYQQAGKEVKKHIVNKEEILIGRNDEEGYYFKFGIYRVGNSTIPVLYNLAGYEEHEKSSGK